ncbi:MAG: cyclic nucleotide-binding domain-containing protein [Bacteroidetes bacterium]|nr:cyclic nucleotide-binding domain-containing protein [Bacteroidota bacterium]
MEKIEEKITELETLENLTGKRRFASKGDMVYRRDEEAHSLYLVVKGSVKVIGNNSTKVFIEDEYFGLDELLNKTIRTQDAQSIDDSELIEIGFSPNKNSQNPINVIREKSIAVKTDHVQPYSYIGPIQNVLSEKEINGIIVVSVNLYRCNIKHSAAFREYLNEIIEKGSTKLLIDLQQCRILDSTFLGTLVASLRKVTSRGGDLRLVTNDKVKTWLFMVTRMDKVFSIYNNADEAMNSFFR